MKKVSAPAPAAIDPEKIRAHLAFLADDLLEGRGTGTRGGEIAARYIAAQFAAIGLEPGAVGGSFLQRVPLVGVLTLPVSRLSFATPAGELVAEMGTSAVYGTHRQVEADAVDAELVFVGHGVVAPQFDWDDYKGVDVSGKVLLMLVDDPPSDDPGFFGGKARTIYGRWTYKYEIARDKGAVGVLLIHTHAAAGYGWHVVNSSNGRESPSLPLSPGDGALSLAGWITETLASDLARSAGEDLGMLTAAAASREFRPVALPVGVHAEISARVRALEGSNVLAVLPGSERRDGVDSQLWREAVVITAHHDHLGIAASVDGDAIYNGAIDNASGVAVMIELARVLRAAAKSPRRQVLFAALTAEEGGLRGSEYMVARPPLPLGRVVVNLNLDGTPVEDEVDDWVLLGAERSDFWPRIQEVAAVMGIELVPDLHPEQGSYYRSDHFNFAKQGVPAISVSGGERYRGRPAEYGARRKAEYRERHYHQPSDEYDPAWSLLGAAQEGEIARALVELFANSDAIPCWNPGDEFEAIRERSLADMAASRAVSPAVSKAR